LGWKGLNYRYGVKLMRSRPKGKESGFEQSPLPLAWTGVASPSREETLKVGGQAETFRFNKPSPNTPQPSSNAVVPPSGTLLTGGVTSAEDEKVKLDTPSVCPVKFHSPVVASLSVPGPVMKAVPRPDKTSAVGETKSMCNELRLKE